MRYMLLCLLFVMILPLAAQDDAAILSSVEVEYSEDGIMLMVRGDFPDSCTELGEIEQSIDMTTEPISLSVMIGTTRPADAMCAQVLTSFESSFVLETDDLPAGTYPLTVNNLSIEVTIDPTACPEVQLETYLYEGQGICFLFPEAYSEMSAEGFVLISIPNSDLAFLLVEILPEEKNLEAIAAVYEDSQAARFGAQDAFILEEDDLRQAYVVFAEKRYIFTLQPTSEEAEAAALWETVMNSLFFYTEE